MPGGHGPMTGFAGDSRKGIMRGAGFQPGHMAPQTAGLRTHVFPDFLEMIGERAGVNGSPPIGVFLRVTGGAGFRAGELLCLEREGNKSCPPKPKSRAESDDPYACHPLVFNKSRPN